MKYLNVLVVIGPMINSKTVKELFSNYSDVSVNIEINAEAVLEAMNQQSFEWLVLDKNLPKEDFKKLSKMLDVLHPEAVLTAANLNDVEFFKSKVEELVGQWRDDSPQINILDDNMGSCQIGS